MKETAVLKLLELNLEQVVREAEGTVELCNSIGPLFQHIRKVLPDEALVEPLFIRLTELTSREIATHARAAYRAPASGSNGYLKIDHLNDLLHSDPPEPDAILQGLFDKGDKLAILGASKARKSWFTQQLAFHIASGRTFLGWQMERPRSVYYAQCEIKREHFHRRVKLMAKELRIDDVEEDVFIVHGRGHRISLDDIHKTVSKEKFEVVIIDPLYKILTGDENLARDMKPVLQEFDRLISETGCALIYVHHDCKGYPGLKEIQDRGAGSGVLGRDYDACITLTQHRYDPHTTVIDQLTRNYEIREPFCAEFYKGAFKMSDLAPLAKVRMEETLDNKVALEDQIARALEVLTPLGLCPLSVAEDAIKRNLGLSRRQAQAVLEALKLRPNIQYHEAKRRIGIPSSIEVLAEQQRSLEDFF